jgi:hypothetical protein
VRPWHVVGGWAAGLTVLAFTLLGFTLGTAPSTPWVSVLYLGSAGLVAAFGLAVLLAARRGREHATQRRQPRRATAAVFLAIGIAVATLGLAYGWVVPLLAVYPLAAAAWMLRGERLPAHARPWPASTDPEPTGPAQLPHGGEPVGVAEPVPVGHPAHAAPPPPAPETPAQVSTTAKVGLGVLFARAFVKLLRRQR